jgi:ABC-type uncharacterized transport system permease subunit
MLTHSLPFLRQKWCEQYYKSSNCVEIRCMAQDEMERYIYAFYYTCAAWAICFIILVRLSAMLPYTHVLGRSGTSHTTPS